MRLCVLVVLVSLIAAPATAGELLGAAYAHDVHGIGVGGSEGGVDIAAGWRSEPVEALKLIGRPRVVAYAVGSTVRATDFATVGLTWRLTLSPHFYLEPGIGGAVTDGVDKPTATGPRRLDLGSRVLFSPQVAAGWKLSPRLSAEASWIHLSHGYLAGGRNPGMDELGLRLAWRL